MHNFYAETSSFRMNRFSKTNRVEYIGVTNLTALPSTSVCLLAAMMNEMVRCLATFRFVDNCMKAVHSFQLQLRGHFVPFSVVFCVLR